MNKKYGTIKDADGWLRVIALKNFTLITGEKVKKGDTGGRIASENCLSQDGLCWIMDDAGVYGRVSENAVIKDYAFVEGEVSGNAVIQDYAEIEGYVSGNAAVKDCGYVYGTVSGNTIVKDFAEVRENATATGNAVVQAWQRINYGTVATDLLGTKDWEAALYAEFGIKPENGKIILYKKVWKTYDESVFKSDYHRNFLYKIGKISRVRKVDEDIFKSCTRGLHFTSLEFVNGYSGDTIIECEVKVPDIVTVQDSKVRARKCRVLRVYKEE